MGYQDILINETLPRTRRTSTYMARRAVAYWAGIDWDGFAANSTLGSLNPDSNALRSLILTALPQQKGFVAFNATAFSAAWKTSVTRAPSPATVQSVYDATWAGVKP